MNALLSVGFGLLVVGLCGIKLCTPDEFETLVLLAQDKDTPVGLQISRVIFAFGVVTFTAGVCIWLWTFVR